MIRHIVLFRVSGTDSERADAISTVRDALLPLARSVPGVGSLRVDADDTGLASHWDVSLVSEHESWDALAGYQKHPDHLAAVEAIDGVVVDRAIVDHEL